MKPRGGDASSEIIFHVVAPDWPAMLEWGRTLMEIRNLPEVVR